MTCAGSLGALGAGARREPGVRAAGPGQPFRESRTTCGGLQGACLPGGFTFGSFVLKVRDSLSHGSLQEAKGRAAFAL